MKIRTGFVSNSSSSSFLIALDKPVKKVEDVYRYIENKKYARRVFKMLENQGGRKICSPPKDKCEVCSDRFVCFTQTRRIYAQLIADYYGYSSVESFCNACEDTVIRVENFVNVNEDKILYILRFADSGEGGNEIESEMRSNADYILAGIRHLEIT